jgi:hypothetical protein
MRIEWAKRAAKLAGGKAGVRCGTSLAGWLLAVRSSKGTRVSCHSSHLWTLGYVAPLGSYEYAVLGPGWGSWICCCAVQCDCV